MVVDHTAVNRVLTNSDCYRKNTPIYFPFAEGAELQNQSDAVKAVFNHKNMNILGNTVVALAEDLCAQLVDSQGNGVPFNVHETCLDVWSIIMQSKRCN